MIGIVSIYKALNPSFDATRLCIKIPSTWEGIEACRVLEKKGISTLATTLFSMEQAALAADAGCTYASLNSLIQLSVETLTLRNFR